MLIPLKKILDILKDPSDNSDLKIKWNGDKIESISNGTKDFQIHKNIPILIDFKKSIFEEKFFQSLNIDISVIGKRTILKKKIKNILTLSSYKSKKTLKIFKSQLPNNPKILIIGGGNIGSGMDSLYTDQSIDIISTDVYPSNKIQFISDCHSLPLKDESFDGVIIQAVLEHVLDPKLVVSEIGRILKINGVVLAETPFMQQSHEEPYDFNRFTELGHRWLFKKFNIIHRESNGGPGLSLYWSIKTFFFSILNNHFLGNILSLPFIILSYLDLIIPEKRKIKGANGFIFIGKKKNEQVTEKEIINEYIGI